MAKKRKRKKRTGQRKANDKLIAQLLRRMEQLELRVGTAVGDEDGPSENSDSMESCGISAMPPRELEAGIDPIRESLIRAIEKKWVNGTELKYFCFSEGPWRGGTDQKNVVSEAFEEWQALSIGLSFRQVDSIEDADIRIGFLRGDGSWS